MLSSRQSVGRHAGAGVAGAGAGDALRAESACRAGAAGHAAVLEAAGRVFALVLEPEVGESGPFSGGSGGIETGVAFLTGHDHFVRDGQDEFTVTPDAGGFDAAFEAPAGIPEFAEFLSVDPGEIALDVEDAAAVAFITEVPGIIGFAAADAFEIHFGRFHGITSLRFL